MQNEPQIGDLVVMRKADVTIEITAVLSDHPEVSEGVFVIKDQYGENHLVEQESGDDFWTVIVPGI